MRERRRRRRRKKKGRRRRRRENKLKEKKQKLPGVYIQKENERQFEETGDPGLGSRGTMESKDPISQNIP